MVLALLSVVYVAVVIGILIFVIDVLRRMTRAAEETAAANTRQAQALEVLASRCEMANRSRDDADAVRQ